VPQCSENPVVTHCGSGVATPTSKLDASPPVRQQLFTTERGHSSCAPMYRAKL
jgi:hypothetical protein